MKILTIFTPTYNRAHLLPKLYNSLCMQNKNDFLWMVIDDGSTDNTKELIESWQTENILEIQYLYKENGGMHTGHNLAYANIKTELNMCIDSDDYVAIDAVRKIKNRWSLCNEKQNIAGIIGLDADFNNKILGTRMPEKVHIGTMTELYFQYRSKGDKKLVLRTDVVRQFPPYPEYEGEKLVPLGSLYLLIDQKFKYLYTNEILCNVEYQESGSTKSIFRQYKQSPKGFAYARKIKLKFVKNNKEILKNCLHLVSCGITTKSSKIIFENNPYKLLTFLLIPFGIGLHLYLLNKIK